MKTAFTKEGISVHVASEIDSSEPHWSAPELFKSNFDNYGYVIARKLIPDICTDAVLASFREEVKPYAGEILRQLSVRMELNRFSDEGFMTNTILSVQDLIDDSLQGFRSNSLSVLTHPNVQNVLKLLLGESATCVESMYFESSSRGTISHADCHFMDSIEEGKMIAAWYALEDIHIDAGRFYIMPESHLLGTNESKFEHLKDFYREYEDISIKTMNVFQKNTSAENAALRVEHQKMLAKGLAGESFYAPLMKKGDVIFWGSKVLHGSLNPLDKSRSRNSLTAHYIGRSQKYIQYGSSVDMHLENINSMPVHHLRIARSAEVI